MKLASVISTNVSTIGFKYGIIKVHFKNGAVYQYPNCDISLFQSFLNASSINF
ncbi:KTSC domain-containing protein [Veillonella sp. AS16]|uniref:KTSC domain-containing protein n=1 Tax=Veillonella sp. AS16 TaxID=936589 RepID=UPI0018DBAAF9